MHLFSVAVISDVITILLLYLTEHRQFQHSMLYHVYGINNTSRERVIRKYDCKIVLYIVDLHMFCNPMMNYIYLICVHIIYHNINRSEQTVIAIMLNINK